MHKMEKKIPPTDSTIYMFQNNTYKFFLLLFSQAFIVMYFNWAVTISIKSL